MKNELLEALEQLEKEKGISKETLLEAIEAALITAYKKNFGSAQNVKITIDRENGDVHVYSRKQVVENVENELFEISLEDAKKIDPNYEIDDIIEKEVTPKNFGRIAAQTAKQVVVQRIREAERAVIYEEFVNRESEIVTGTIQRISKGIVYINLGKTEAILLPNEQIQNEVYTQGSRIKTYIVEVKKTTKGPQILVSRTHPGLVKRLFELEVPEIHDGIVEIKSISREAGSRTKIAVYSSDLDVDPVGACVGQKGARVQNIVDELRGEKIDIIKWSENPSEFISNSLSPSKVEKVIINEEEKSALVIVPDYQLSLAIGKEGQNARLAAKLTGWKIDIKSLSQFEESLVE
ncbi:NusA antitermination factor [Caminicella sporogenes DSM 14501]|uniref:Transcription termination/antitermination protein NusA n=1 Tax=Caminicella sporogenes DSM 14501 TaxID=1121266 RepID=A0A1M6L8I1_9FIRM|nr:transcription termination factor NusA [Caminicella sporogenes]RKD27744.1 transcription termination/antitermination protein NusA [Caminicella sporogenes]SHJ67500.1 NusA antitermination factor [Caminicella sporogenes DSM 14501]